MGYSLISKCGTFSWIIQ